MSQSRVPSTWKGFLTVLAGLAAVVIVVFAATSGGLLLGLILIAVLWVVLYALGYRLDLWLREKQFFGGDD